MHRHECESIAMKTLSIVAALLITTSAFAGTRDNDDTCDIKVGPAATLLLPYFEVDISGNSGQTTLFTVTNVTRYPQIARVTLWTDLAYPVLTFNLYLTGYDIQAINIADVLKPGIVASPTGTSSTTTPGPLSSSTSPNLITPLNCANNPGVIPASIISAVRRALSFGDFGPDGSSACFGLGFPHSNAIGYATIDVVSNCNTRSPADPLYYTNDILFDNVLIGDYQQLGPHPQGEVAGSFDGGGNPMVHIRAVPEGGAAGATCLNRSFQLPFGETIRFDERENAFIFVASLNCTPCQPIPSLTAASSTASSNGDLYPPLNNSDVAGWLYLNLNNGGSPTYSVTHDVGGQPVSTNQRSNLSPSGSTTTTGPRPSQNWVTVTMFGNVGANRLTTEFDAAALGNGCSPAAFLTTANGGTQSIGPAGGVFVCPPGPTLTNGTLTQCTGTNVNPLP
jgi:hypothetical protein